MKSGKMAKKIAIILFNLGGPDKSENIKPFLRNLFSDPAIISLPNPMRAFVAWLISTTRAPKAKPLYDIMGGFSPLLENTKAQANSIEKVICEKYPDFEIKTFIAMRYWHPLSQEVAKQVDEFAPDETILLPLYPHYSITTTGSSFKEWERFSKQKNKKINSYQINSGMITTMVKNIMAEWERIGAPQRIRILFSAHGLPQKIIDAGDPYEAQINETAAAVSKILPPFFETIVCYQSKVGPLKWLGPSTPDEIVRASRDKIGIIICPIAFVSDHIETLVELDVEYKEMAHDLGLPFFGRSNTLGTDSDFINGLVELISEKLENENA
jgi:protoporphyrin/coproporphyrin ferrochelatase